MLHDANNKLQPIIKLGIVRIGKIIVLLMFKRLLKTLPIYFVVDFNRHMVFWNNVKDANIIECHEQNYARKYNTH